MEKILTELVSTLDMHGLKAGLQWLNDRVPHRWTAVYRLDEDLLMRNIQIVDKQNEPELGALAIVPVQDSFCQFTMRDGHFLSHNTAEDSDPRLEGHIYKGVLNSYCGLPLMRDMDKMYGTLCHFDSSPHLISDSEFEFLQRVARILPRYLERAST